MIIRVRVYPCRGHAILVRTHMMRVLLIEDSPETVQSVGFCLELRWPNTILLVAAEGARGLEMVETELPDLVILALDLPDIDGLQLIQQIRTFSDVSIIVLTARQSETDKARALEKGADDYILKPLSPIDFLARIKAVLRRAGMPAFKEDSPPPFSCAGLTIDFASRRVSVWGEPVRLTPTEYSLLYHLVRNEGKVLTHRMLLEKVWGTEYDDITFVKKYVHRLRVKLEDNAVNPQTIITERGIGYKLVRSV